MLTLLCGMLCDKRTNIDSGYLLESTFNADADAWTTDGEWERRMSGNTSSRRTDRTSASATLTTNLTEGKPIAVLRL